MIKNLLIAAYFLFIYFNIAELQAQSIPKVICASKKSGTLSLKAKCSSKERLISNRASLIGAKGDTGAAGPSGAAGPTGASGATGADGQLRIYGNGSAGTLSVDTSGALFVDYATNKNLQFSSITVNTSRILTVAAGTILRATGDVLINGRIEVEQGSQGGILGTYSGAFSNNSFPAISFPSPGLSKRAASFGEIGSNSQNRLGGVAGEPLAIGSKTTISDRFLLGGGGGAGADLGLDGAAGGGTVIILAQGSITISPSGSIYAKGANATTQSGSGGGAGGVIILASKTSISSSGVIDVTGGSGATGSVRSASGGGGGGGLVYAISPVLTVAGTVNLDGGSGGAALSSGEITDSLRIGGGAGGSCVGTGGAGADALTDGSCNVGSAGTSGLLEEVLTDPTAIF